MTPPNCRALSLHAPAAGRQLQPYECAAIYVGRAYEEKAAAVDQESVSAEGMHRHAARPCRAWHGAHSGWGSHPPQDPARRFLSAAASTARLEQAYLFNLTANAISEASGSAYSGQGLVMDAARHCNEAAFANCVFGSSLQRSLQPEVRAFAALMVVPAACPAGPAVCEERGVLSPQRTLPTSFGSLCGPCRVACLTSRYYRWPLRRLCGTLSPGGRTWHWFTLARRPPSPARSCCSTTISAPTGLCRCAAVGQCTLACAPG